MTKFCSACGEPVATDALYCVRCGAALLENATEATDWENPYAASSSSSAATGRFVEEYADPTAPDIPGFFGAFVVCMKKYFSCKGRASRSEFWYFQLTSFLLIACVGAVVGGVVGGVLGGMNAGKSAEELSSIICQTVAPIGNIMRLFFFFPTLAVCCRRLHDRGWSSWLLLWFVLPLGAFIASVLLNIAYGVVIFLLIGYALWFFFVVQFCLPGTPGTNKYGPAPWKRNNK